MITSRQILAINLKYYRYSHNLSQEKFAYQIGSSLTYVNQIETQKRNVSIDMLDKIAEFFNITSSMLLTYDKSHVIHQSRVDRKNNI